MVARINPRLAHSQSLYIKQHERNPVDWRPWDEEAFAEARRRDVPVFVSIGYAACHWCHVMAHESFEDEATARLLNERFVSVKVDREEHPEVDDAYMAATQAMTGQGGWPMSVFTLTDGRVFHAGTYFPHRRRGQVPSFTEVLNAVHAAWTERRAEVEESAAKIAESLGGQRRQQARLATRPAPDERARSSQDQPFSPAQEAREDQSPVQLPDDQDGADRVSEPARFTELRDAALDTLAENEDEAHGGFGAAPKFPPSPMLGFLLEDAAWEPEGPAAGLAFRTLEAMGRSALFDQIEGGFARYATDRAWALPHFEKMLSDNAQLLSHYARCSVHPAASYRQRDDARRTAELTVDFLRRRMLLPEGLLASSLDADSPGESGDRVEGGAYLFSDAELRAAADESGCDAEAAEQLVRLNHGVSAEEHAAPVHLAGETPRTIHFDAPLSPEQRDLWEQVLPVLRRRRAQRAQPARDEKVVASWNAQTVSALAEAAAFWGDEEVLSFAGELADRLWDVHVCRAEAERGTEDGTQRVEEDEASLLVRRTSYGGTAGEQAGTLSDHAQMALACFALASAGAGEDDADDAGGSGLTPHLWIERGGSVLSSILTRFLRWEDEGDGRSLTVLESLDPSGLLRAAQGGEAHAAPFDGPEPSGIAALALALQRAEALALLDRLPTPSGASAEKEAEVPRAADLLHHLPLAAPRAPSAVGTSLLAGAREMRRSPAFRLVGGTSEHLSEVRRAGALYGLPVEPVAQDAVEAGRPLRLSVCLNGRGAMVCLPPSDSVLAALDAVRS